ncbi:MAG: glutamate--tRNA ligase [Candidatus Doudnabacteria bacterium RIFCSPLOWO2_02_FULL_42_9]|uniref:Glutamate--tRNA ligase n=1 Tax=Candidatus Doudnabacteria bacterium RIFCSPHIGHO2_01_FULL_41_86 TaxID=1817821 RepID=A0A1F5N8E9_9BACT|nr:MAG: glutamate--tRNA ligase [Candidatus Doudnabacteria bacterium RIFCSPHIGHO2_01_FULL_41_86]OGE75877.1 MAG: glutamate--tRNA ligase [Candidatus Doudnabacteria bacterium RIFCSPHIGHO2_01_43_10]OGE86251.1 MAG: glutamate--tRNA ligase [Candidatus Doudnabacteria bacterium RIFCSPHIGHO2_12_FULL_42_22]OGE87099.1 MAG: glutamate--tRNA ligase [Candidatus Doudnabacteria bacterium RIFCSPHIGHO2_02_FULL_42_25]OGE92239.1 MAG: glutamate--tRNA ligase [Candidatus Doudnabacteria bacterium RIFCSPLOWO2_01_FULL_42_6
MSQIRVRFGPSPTGNLHVGGLRTALYDYLFAKKNKGTYILRIEDTDKARTVPGALDNIVQTLHELGLTSDEGPYWNNGVKVRGDFGPYQQSERLSLYSKHAGELVKNKHAYYCFCTPERLEELRNTQEAAHQPPKYDKHCLKLTPEEVNQKLLNQEKHVVRLNVPADQTITFTDMVHGEISISSNDVDDQVLLKSDGYPTYHLASVVDDHLMKISHVIRGEEWIPSTPKHILLYAAFEWDQPQFAHLPLLLSKSKKKLSKRDGDVAVKDFLKQGYLPEALINFVVFLGWNPKTEQEIFTIDELVEQFSFGKVNKSGAVFDLDKLDWINGMYIRKMDVKELYDKILLFLPEAETKPKSFIYKILELERERLKKLSEIGERVKYFFSDPEYDPKLLIWKKASKENIKRNLSSTYEHIRSQEVSEDSIKKFIEENNLKTGEVLWPLRVALTGMEASPGPFEIMDTFMVLPNGKELILNRINKAISSL